MFRERPASSRNLLKWYVFEEKEPDVWQLVLEPFYAALIEDLVPGLLDYSRFGWRETHNPKYIHAILDNLSIGIIERVQNVLEAYGEYVVLAINRQIRPHFSRELDFCTALSYNFDIGVKGRSEIGQLVYEAKWKRSYNAANDLTDRLVRMTSFLPCFQDADDTYISCIPPRNEKVFDLPTMLVVSVVQQLCSEGREIGIVQADMTADKPSFKDLSVEAKIRTWEHIYTAGQVELRQFVEGCTMYVIDDLYQSGATLWSYARFLKSKGAKYVIGIACVKTLRDTDNQQ